jgi:spore coat protein U-like protein
MRNGGSGAKASRAVTISTPFAFVSAPAAVNFAGTVGGNQVLSSTMPLDVSNGAAAGWSLSATSTTWSTGGASPGTLPITATTIATTPTVACDVPASCNLAASNVGVPYVLPAGATAPTATKFFNAGAATGVGNQTITPTLKLSVPSNVRAGTYHTTITVTLSSGP